MTIEQEIEQRASKAPRVTPADIEAEIASEHYFTAADGVVGTAANDWRNDSTEALASSVGRTIERAAMTPSLALLTFCVLVLRNGFTVTGESACASPESFDADIGRKVARAAAVAKVWPLLGFRLRDALSATEA